MAGKSSISYQSVDVVEHKVDAVYSNGTDNVKIGEEALKEACLNDAKQEAKEISETNIIIESEKISKEADESSLTEENTKSLFGEDEIVDECRGSGCSEFNCRRRYYFSLVDSTHSNEDFGSDDEEETLHRPERTYSFSHRPSSHKKGKIFLRPKRGFGLVREPDLNGHVGLVHGNQKQFQRDYRRERKSDLSRHVVTSHGEEERLQTSERHRRFVNKSYPKKHVDRVDEKREASRCSDCGARFTDKAAFYNHVVVDHKKKRPYTCSECDRCYVDESYLNKHMTFTHANSKPYRCSQCDHRSSSKFNLSKHVRAVHRVGKRYRCFECDYFSLSKTYLLRHIIFLHDKENPLL